MKEKNNYLQLGSNIPVTLTRLHVVMSRLMGAAAPTVTPSWSSPGEQPAEKPEQTSEQDTLLQHQLHHQRERDTEHHAPFSEAYQ